MLGANAVILDLWEQEYRVRRDRLIRLRHSGPRLMSYEVQTAADGRISGTRGGRIGQLVLGRLLHAAEGVAAVGPPGDGVQDPDLGEQPILLSPQHA